jgi:ATP-binding cassette subfamily F protein uup
MLSGGEKKRLQLLTILFRNPNFLILDEPTNDLDLPTLAVLENFLSEFQGCLILVSHDRYFMDKMINHLFVFEGNGIVKDFPGNYSQYRQSIVNSPQSTVPGSQWLKVDSGEKIPVTSNLQPATRKQLTYKEKRELENLGKEIEELTKEKEKITQQLNSGTTSYDELQEISNRIGVVTSLLDEKELRWLELSELVG